MKRNTKTILTLTAGCIPFLALLVVAIVAGIQYDREVGGFLKQAADANTTELAEEKLKKAIEGMEERGLCQPVSAEKPVKFGTDCYTSVLWRTPDEDVGYWRENIQATYDDLAAMTAQERADHLTSSNQLMKVRETLLDSGERGDTVTDPAGISLYPHNALFAWGLLISLLLAGGTFYRLREDLFG